MTSKGTPGVAIVAAVALVLPLACSGEWRGARRRPTLRAGGPAQHAPRRGSGRDAEAGRLDAGAGADRRRALRRGQKRRQRPVVRGRHDDRLHRQGRPDRGHRRHGRVQQTALSARRHHHHQLHRSGQIAMSAATNLPAEVVIGELGSMTHTFPTFGGLDGLVPVAGFTISQVATVARGAGSAYTGTLSNGFDTAVSAPTVTIFPVNRVGRPLGAAMANATTDIPPGGSWSFETSPVDDPGVDYVAYPSASIN